MDVRAIGAAGPALAKRTQDSLWHARSLGNANRHPNGDTGLAGGSSTPCEGAATPALTCSAVDARKIKLPLAYRRVCDELAEQPKSGRTFIPNPFEQELVEVDLDEWLADLERRIAKGDFIPGAIELCGAPKGGDLIRPAARMSLADRVVYSAAVGACIKPIVAATRWSQGRIDCALLFNPKHAHQRRWLRTPFEGWLKMDGD
jgi:hypothetical protein